MGFQALRFIPTLVVLNQDGKIVYTLKCSRTDKAEMSDNIRNNGDTSSEISKKIAAINRELERTGVALCTVLQRYGVNSIEEMSESTYRYAMNSLKKTKAKAA